MALTDFSEQLEAADSVPDLARMLGERCLAGAAELRVMKEEERTGEELELIEVLAGNFSYAVWEEVIRDPAGVERRLGADLIAAVERAKVRQPLDFLGVLRGLCGKALAEFFAGAAGEVELVKGLPLPFAERPLPNVLGGDLTTTQETLNDDGLLFPLPFDLYNHVADEELRVILDFRHAKRLDALTWEEEKKLPRIATLHPEGGGEFEIEREGDGTFFGVRPMRWDPDAVRALLERAKAEGARLAVLPELSLPSPDALEEDLARNHGAYPPIVVAGSAHCEIEAADGSAGVRANESRVYLDGVCVVVARKHHRFKAREPGDEPSKQARREDLTREQKTLTILSGAHTRLGVAICADLLEVDLPRLLVDAGVNLLLVPAMTQKTGSFNAAVTGIAGMRQGVAAVANTRWGDDGKPFLCLCAVPRSEPRQQSAALRGDRNPVPQLAIFDPNEPLPEAVTWPR